MNEYAVYSSVNPYFTNSSGQQQQTIVPVAEKEAPVFFVNRNGMLEEQSTQSGADPAGNARAVVQFDMDDDGALDMMVNNFNGPAMLYRNNGASGNHWIKIHLTGDPSKGVTRDAIGAKILVDTAAPEKPLARSLQHDRLPDLSAQRTTPRPRHRHKSRRNHDLAQRRPTDVQRTGRGSHLPNQPIHRPPKVILSPADGGRANRIAASSGRRSRHEP